MNTLAASTKAIESGSSSRRQHVHLDREPDRSRSLTQRDALASQIRAALDAAAFGDDAINEQQAKDWINQAEALIDAAAALGS